MSFEASEVVVDTVDVAVLVLSPPSPLDSSEPDDTLILLAVLLVVVAS